MLCTPKDCTSLRKLEAFHGSLFHLKYKGVLMIMIIIREPSYPTFTIFIFTENVGPGIFGPISQIKDTKISYS